MRDVPQFQKAQVGQHAEGPLHERQEAVHEEPRRDSPKRVAPRQRQKGPTDRLILEQGETHGQQESGYSRIHPHVDQLAAAADPPDLENGRNDDAEHEEIDHQIVAQGQRDDQRSEAS